MPKLLQINVTSNWGSTGKIAEAIGLAAQKNGWECYTAYGRYENPSKLQTLKVGGAMDTYLHFAADRLLDMEGRASVRATKRLIGQIKDIQPDVMQLHNIHDHYLNYPLLFEYLNQTDIKVVWAFHDCWAFTGHCYHFVESGCEKWQKECGNCPLRNRFIDRSRENFLLKKELFTANKNLTIVPVSQWMAEFVGQSFLKEKRIQVIHNGVDLGVFKPLQNSESIVHSEKLIVLAVSSVWPKSKGLEDIIKLRSLLPREYEITVVGVNEKQIESLPEGITGIRRTQNVQELVELYGTADVLINTTYADTFPTVNLEALACGTPVITYKTGGSPEAIDDKTGVVVPQGDVEALAEAIREMRANPLSREDCRKRAEECFDKEKCFGEYVGLYERLLVN